jgi:hypothetical protein
MKQAKVVSVLVPAVDTNSWPSSMKISWLARRLYSHIKEILVSLKSTDGLEKVAYK